MKELLADAAFIAVAVGLILWGCSRSILIDENDRLGTRSDTTFGVVRDTTDMADTSGVPIVFDVTVDDWEEVEWN